MFSEEMGMQVRVKGQIHYTGSGGGEYLFPYSLFLVMNSLDANCDGSRYRGLHLVNAWLLN